MAQTLTASDLLKAQGRIAEAFSGDTPSKYPYFEPAMSAAALLLQNANLTQDSFLSNGKYTGTEVNWLTKGATNSVKFNGVPGSSDQACTIGTAEGATSAAQLYSNNMSIVARVEVDDDVYGNMFNPSELIADRLMVAMQDIRNALNTKMINFLSSNKTPINNDASLADGIVFNGTSDIFEVDKAKIDLQNADGLTDLEVLAMNNDIQRHFFLTGRYNFYNSIVNAQWRQRNADEAYMSRFFDPAYNIYMDPRSLDSTLTGSNTFIVGEGTYAVWDFVDPRKSTVPTQVAPDRWEYYIEDPVLKIRSNGVIRPLRYNVYYTRDCNDVNADVGNRTYMHKFEVFLLGGLVAAPASADTHTGILQLQSVTV